MDKKKIFNFAIGIIFAIVYLTVSIKYNAWAYSWIIFVIYRFITK